MNKRDFNKLLKSCTVKGKFSIEKIEKLPVVLRGSMVLHIVRNRGPILANLIPANFDFNWLKRMGYLYRTKGKEFEFVHTCEHSIK